MLLFCDGSDGDGDGVMWFCVFLWCWWWCDVVLWW